MRTEVKYDIFNIAKRRGQEALIELPRVGRKDNPSIRLKAKDLERIKRGENVKKEAEVYEYAREHPDLCPHVGTVIKIRNQYGVRAKLTVKMVLGGLPATEFELLPMSEQPERLQDSAILAKHAAGCGRPGWVQWADRDAWERYQQLQGRSLRPWEDEVMADETP